MAAAAAMEADQQQQGCESPVHGLIPQHLLTPRAHNTNNAANASPFGAAAASGGGYGSVDAGGVGTPVAAAALVDLSGAAPIAGAAGGAAEGGKGPFAGFSESGWGAWGFEGGLANAPSQVGPSCITTGMD